MPELIIHTDGACRGNPGPGGWGVLLDWNGTVKELCGAEPQTTNNRMELLAAIMGLSALKRPAVATLQTDSQYVIKGVTEWLPAWKARGWRTADRKPVKNQDLWEKLDRLAGEHTLKWQWVKGHSGDPGNERVDALANLAIDVMLAESRRPKVV
ncbi:MAG TPA: ribonuclease HI [Steroidobacteraceae bacterium]|nr:ribonuclease HI [Steroidobacteraceae bacterium]